MSESTKRWKYLMSRVRSGTAAILICACLPASADGQNTVTLTAAFTPNRLDAETTMTFGIKIGTLNGQVPSPVTKMRVQFPAGIGFTSSTLGLATCDPVALEAEGLEGCSPNARIGVGSAAVELPLGPETFYEAARVTALAGPPNKEHLIALFYAEGKTPVWADLVFATEIAADSGIFGTQMNALVQPIPGIPRGPNLSVVSFSSSIGPKSLTYYKSVHGNTVAFHPKGPVLPSTCPAGGFPFAASFSFEDGSEVTTRTTVPCPRRHRKRR
jgi:hypothetical protein